MLSPTPVNDLVLSFSNSLFPKYNPSNGIAFDSSKIERWSHQRSEYIKWCRIINFDAANSIKNSYVDFKEQAHQCDNWLSSNLLIRYAWNGHEKIITSLNDADIDDVWLQQQQRLYISKRIDEMRFWRINTKFIAVVIEAQTPSEIRLQCKSRQEKS